MSYSTKIKLESIETSQAFTSSFKDSLLLSSDDSLSPLPSPSELPTYLFDKIKAESNHHRRDLFSVDYSPSECQESPRIPPSGTPVKSENKNASMPTHLPLQCCPLKNELDTLSSDTTRGLTDSEIEPNEDEEFIRLAFLKCRFVEFTNTVPAFPKTHPDGYAYIIELSPEILNEKALLGLRDGLQYSLTNGGGPKVYGNVEFFAAAGNKVPMKIHSRQCVGNTISMKNIEI